MDATAEFTAEPSRNLLVMAQQSQRRVEHELKIPLRDAQSTLTNVETANNITSFTISNFAKYIKYKFKIESVNTFFIVCVFVSGSWIKYRFQGI